MPQGRQLAEAAGIGSDEGLALARDDAPVECRCSKAELWFGQTARRYSERHLVVEDRYDYAEHSERYWPWTEPLPGPHGARLAEKRAEHLARWRGRGHGELICPDTAWRFEETWSLDPAEYRIKRRPWTTTADYVDRTIVERRAEEVRVSNRLIHETVPFRERSASDYRAWHAATDRWKRADRALYSPDFDLLLRRMSHGDPDAIEAGTVYLEVDPWVFRSGYYRQKVYERLSRAPRRALDRERIEAAIVVSVAKGPREGIEWRALRRLCRHLSDPAFEARLREAARGARSPGHARALLELANEVADPSKFPGRGRGRRTARGRPRRRS
jgi:hypothetical protein